MSVSDAAAIYRAGPKSIYGWLRGGIVDGDRNLVLELNRLKKENEQLCKMLGAQQRRYRTQKTNHPGRGRTRMAQALCQGIWCVQNESVRKAKQTSNDKSFSRR